MRGILPTARQPARRRCCASRRRPRRRPPNEPLTEPNLFFLLEQLHRDREALLLAYGGAGWAIPSWEWLNLWNKYRVLREGVPLPVETWS